MPDKEEILSEQQTLIALGAKKFSKATIKKWLSINKKQFRKNPDVFTEACVVIKIEGEYSDTKWLKGAYQFFSFVGAVKQLMILHDCIGEDTDLNRELLTENECWAFRWAAKNDHLDVVNTLWAFADGNKKLQRQFLKAKDCYAFRCAAENGHLGMVNALWAFAGEDKKLQRKLLTANNSWAFRCAAENDHLDVVNALWAFAGEAKELQRELLTASDCYAFRWTAENGHLDVVKTLCAFAGDDAALKRQLLMATDCAAFRYASSNNHLDMLKTLCAFAGDNAALKRQLLMATDCYAFRSAAEEGHLDMLKTLWAFAGDDKKLKKRWLEICNERDFNTDIKKTVIASIATTDLIELVSQYRVFSSSHYLKELITKGADINACNNEGKSVLELAIRASNDKLATALLEQGAEITEENVDSILKAFLEEAQKSRTYCHPLAKKIFTAISVKSIKFNYEEAFQNAPPHLKRRYQEVVEGKSIIELEIRAGNYSFVKYLLERGNEITQENVTSILKALTDSFQTLTPKTEESTKHLHLAEKIFKEISTKSIKFNYEEAFSDAPQLGEYYQSIRSGVIRRTRSPFFLSAPTTHHAVNLGIDEEQPEPPSHSH